MAAKRKEEPKKINYFFIALYILAIVLLFLIFKPFLTFMILGGIIVILTYPLNLWLRKVVRSKTWTAIIMTVLVLLLILVPVIIIGTALIQQSSGLINTISRIDLDAMSHQVSELINHNIDLKTFIFPTIKTFAEFTADSIPSLIGSITELLINLFVMFFLMYYLYKEGDVMLEDMMRMIPIPGAHKKELAKETKKVLKGVLYGQFLVSLIQGILGGIGFWIFGVPNPILWGSVMVVMGFVPFLGTPLIWGPAVAIEFASGNVGTAIGLLIYSGVLVMNIDNFLKPKLIGRETGMHPVLVLLGIFGGIAFFGLIGMIIGPVIVALAVLVIKFFNKDFVFE